MKTKHIFALCAFLALAAGCQQIKSIIEKSIDSQPPPAASADAVPFDSLQWTVGGQKVSDRPITIDWEGGATFNNNGCSFALPSYNNTSAYAGGKGDAPYLFCLFVVNKDGNNVGGKIDWIGARRQTRDFKHMDRTKEYVTINDIEIWTGGYIDNGYHNWHDLQADVHAADNLFCVIIGGNGRSPVMEFTRR